MLEDNTNLEAKIPKLRVPEEVRKIYPENILQYLNHMSDWNVMKDGEEHKNVRRASQQNTCSII